MSDIADEILQLKCVIGQFEQFMTNRRESIVTAVLAGLAANPYNYNASPITLAIKANEQADALIAELDKDTPDANH